MGDYGPAGTLVDLLIQRVGMLDVDDAADLYRAAATRLLISGSQPERDALHQARRAAARVGRADAYNEARHAAAAAWRSGVPSEQGPWLLVGSAIANAAGALVVEDVLDRRSFEILFGPWQQAVGRLVAVGPGAGVTQGRASLARGRRT